MKKNDVKTKRTRIDFHPRFFLVLGAFLFETTLVILFFLLLFLTDWSDYYVYSSAVLMVLNFIFAIFIVNSQSQINYKVSWLAVILGLPVIGLVLYILYAYKITTRTLKKLEKNPLNQFMSQESKRYDDHEIIENLKSKDNNFANIAITNSNHCFPIYNNTNIKYYDMGEKAVEDIVNALKNAKKFIFIEFFIIEYGQFYDLIFNTLIEKANEGLDIRLVYDDFGCSTYLPKNFDALLRKKGIKAYKFNPIKPTMNIRQNSRDHRKIIVIDGIYAFTGGCNIGDEYINKKNRFGIWKDNFIFIEGEATQSLTTIFLSNYFLYSKDADLNLDKFSFKENKYLLKNEIINSSSFIQPIAGIPYSQKFILRNAFLSMINRASKYIYLSTPYLIPDNELITALINASNSGVEVKIFTPGIPDKKMVYQATKSYYPLFLLNGIKIYEFTPGFNHEKTMIVDDKIAITGTCNFDFRSFYLHFENSVLIYEDDVILEMKKSFEDMEKVSKKQPLDKYINVKLFRKIYWSILRLISPLL